MLLVSCSAQRMAAQLAFPLVQGQYTAMQEEADLGLAAEALGFDGRSTNPHLRQRVSWVAS